MYVYLRFYYVNYLYLDNYYDIYTIQSKFIEMWRIDQTKPDIPVSRLLLDFSCQYHPFINKFFVNNTVTYQEYFLFVGIFVFFEIKNIISLMLVICNVYSNKFITNVYILFIETNMHIFGYIRI